MAPGWGQSRELQPGLPCGWQGPKSLTLRPPPSVCKGRGRSQEPELGTDPRRSAVGHELHNRCLHCEPQTPPNSMSQGLVQGVSQSPRPCMWTPSCGPGPPSGCSELGAAADHASYGRTAPDTSALLTLGSVPGCPCPAHVDSSESITEGSAPAPLRSPSAPSAGRCSTVHAGCWGETVPGASMSGAEQAMHQRQGAESGHSSQANLHVYSTEVGVPEHGGQCWQTPCAGKSPGMGRAAAPPPTGYELRPRHLLARGPRYQ